MCFTFISFRDINLRGGKNSVYISFSVKRKINYFKLYNEICHFYTWLKRSFPLCATNFSCRFSLVSTNIFRVFYCVFFCLERFFEDVFMWLTFPLIFQYVILWQMFMILCWLGLIDFVERWNCGGGAISLSGSNNGQ